MNLFQRKPEPEPQDAARPDASEEYNGTTPHETPMEVLVHGNLTRKPEKRQDRKGKFYVVSKMAVESEPKLHLSLTCFKPVLGKTLETMDAGDALTVQGPLIIFNDAENKFGVNVRRMVSNFRQVRN